jgi:release factor glutamine methyltransferase
MHTVAGAKAWIIGELKDAEVESPALTAEVLLAFVLGWNRVRVLSHAEESVPEEAWVRLQDLVFRHVKGEPLQYLTGEREFYGLAFRVTPDVLIPRPETEILVETALGLVRRNSMKHSRFLDIGTGSGCIAISFAHENPGSIGWAVDLSNAALKIARENAIRHGVSERLMFVQADLFECFSSKSVFDLILCNPPYVALEDYDSLPSGVRNFEPYLALFGGSSGLEVYRRFIPQISSRLESEGYLLMELGIGQSEEVGQLVESQGLSLEMIVDDLQGIPRCLVARKSLRSHHG